MTVTARKLKKVHVHMLVWNLRAMRNNAVYCPFEESRREYQALLEKYGPLYEAELRERKFPSLPTGPETKANQDQWEAALQRALGRLQ